MVERGTALSRHERPGISEAHVGMVIRPHVTVGRFLQLPEFAAADDAIENGDDAPSHDAQNDPDDLLEEAEIIAPDDVDDHENRRERMQEDGDEDLEEDLHDPAVLPGIVEFPYGDAKRFRDAPGSISHA
jgi:hypothetical protein